MREVEQILRDQKEELENIDLRSLIERDEEQEFDLESNLAQIVIGVRRCGKSTLCLKVLKQSGVHFAYANFDDAVLAALKPEQMNVFMELLYQLYGNFTHLFIDEIQNVDKWPMFVNRLLRQKIHIVLTGSNANLLSDELSTHITGRYNEIRLFPFSFQNYCNFLGVDTQKDTTKEIGLRQNTLEKYLFNGGLPETLKIKNGSKYTLALLDAIVNKDICRRYKIKYVKTLQQIANGILDKFCQEVTYKTLQDNYSIKSIHTVKNYVSYIERAYLIRLLPKYSFKSIERQTSQKAYCIDNAFISNHPDVLQSENFGWRLENTVAIELFRRTASSMCELFYLKEYRNYEVDFAVVQRGHLEELIQVTYDFSEPSKRLFNREIGGLVKGAKATGCHNLTLIMMYGNPCDVEVDGFTVHCVLATDWLLNRK